MRYNVKFILIFIIQIQLFIENCNISHLCFQKVIKLIKYFLNKLNCRYTKTICFYTKFEINNKLVFFINDTFCLFSDWRISQIYEMRKGWREQNVFRAQKLMKESNPSGTFWNAREFFRSLKNSLGEIYCEFPGKSAPSTNSPFDVVSIFHNKYQFRGANHY